MALHLDLRTMIWKEETTPGTSVIGSMANSDFDLQFRDIKITKEIAEYAIKVANGGHDHDRSIMGKRKGTVSGFVDIRYSGTSATAPNIAKILKACGQLESHPATNTVFSPDKELDVSCVSILVQDEYLGGADPKALGLQFKGCMGNCKIVSDQIGDSIRLEFEMQGIFIGVADIPNANILVMTGEDTAQPDATLDAITVFGGNTKLFEKFELDLGNDIGYLTDSGDSDGTGLGYTYVKTRSPRCSFDPKATLVEEQDEHSAWISGTEQVFSFNTTNFSIDAAKAQIVSMGDDDADMLKVNTLGVKFNRDAAYPFTFTQK